MTKTMDKISLLSLSFPILIEQILRNFMGTVNVFMLSSYSDNAVAAVGVANQVYNVVNMIISMLAGGATVLINQSLGAKKDAEALKIGMNSLGISIVIGLAVSILLVVTAPFILAMLGLSNELIEEGVSYLQWIGASSLFLSVSTLLTSLFRCYGNAKIPMFVVIIANIINIAGNWIVIFRPFETPLVGTSGVAVVRFISELIGMLLLIYLLIRSNYGYLVKHIWQISGKVFRKILGIGFMSGADGVAYNLGQVITTSFFAALGAAALSAKVYVQTVDYYAFVVGFSVATAAQIIAGQMMGAGKLDEAYHYMHRIWRRIFLINMSISLAVFLLHVPIMGLFTKSQEIISMTFWLFALCLLTNAGRTLNFAYFFGLRAGGYVLWPMVFNIACIWINVGLGYVLSAFTGLGIIGLWIGMSLDDFFRGAFASVMWRLNGWKKTAIKLRNFKEDDSEEQAPAEQIDAELNDSEAFSEQPAVSETVQQTEV